MDLLRIKSRACGHFARDEGGGGGEGGGGESGAGSDGGGDNNTRDNSPSQDTGGLSVDSTSSSPAPGATESPNAGMSLAAQYSAYGVGKMATDAATGTGTAANGYTSTAGTVNEVGAASTGSKVLTAIKTALAVVGLGTPAAAGSAVALGTMANSGAYDGWGAGPTTMSGASEAWGGSDAVDHPSGNASGMVSPSSVGQGVASINGWPAGVTVTSGGGSSGLPSLGGFLPGGALSFAPSNKGAGLIPNSYAPSGYAGANPQQTGGMDNTVLLLVLALAVAFLA